MGENSLKFVWKGHPKVWLWEGVLQSPCSPRDRCTRTCFRDGPGAHMAQVRGALRPRQPRASAGAAVGAQAQCADPAAPPFPTPLARSPPRAGADTRLRRQPGQQRCSPGSQLANSSARLRKNNMWIPNVDRASSSSLPPFPEVSSHCHGHGRRRARSGTRRPGTSAAPARLPRSPRPLPSGAGAGGGEAARRVGSAPPRPLGTPRPPPPAREASPGPGRAAGRGAGRRAEGAAGPGAERSRRPSRARRVTCPRRGQSPDGAVLGASRLWWGAAETGDVFEPGLGGVRGGGEDLDSNGGAEALVPGIDPPAPAVPRVRAGEGGVATGEEEGGARFQAPAPEPGRSPSVAPAPVPSPERGRDSPRPAAPRWQYGCPAGSAVVAARRELPERGAGAPRAAAPLPEHGGAAARVRAREWGSECARLGGRRREPGGVGAGRPQPGAAGR